MNKNLNKVRESNAKYLVFETIEQRNNFILLYKDLFVPYSINGWRYHCYKDDECKSKQLLEGYLINPLVRYDLKYSLVINIKASDFNRIKEKLKLKKNFLDRGKSYWSLE